MYKFSWHFNRATACNAAHGISKAFLSVRLSVCLSNACIVIKQKKLLPFSHTIRKNVYPSFPTRRMVRGDDPLYLKFWTKLPPFEQNPQFSIVTNDCRQTDGLATTYVRWNTHIRTYTHMTKTQKSRRSRVARGIYCSSYALWWHAAFAWRYALPHDVSQWMNEWTFISGISP